MKREFILLPPKVKFSGLTLILIGLIFCVFTIKGLFVDCDVSWLEMKIPALVSESISGKTRFFTMIETNLGFTISGILLIAGGLLMAFSREEIEDEFVNHLRLKAFQYAVIINYFILFLSYLTVWELSFVWIMLINLYSTLFLFIVIFQILLVRTKKSRKDEE
jgi:hypothetical protein